MDYGKLLSRAWEIIWEHKFLILLGVLVVLSSGGNNSGSFYGAQYRVDAGDRPFGPGAGRDWLPALEAWSVALIVLVVVLVMAIALVLWGISTIARGGLISAVDEIDGGGSTSFRAAWRAGWARGWRLIGIGLVPAIPGLLILLPVLVMVAVWWATPVAYRLGTAEWGVLAALSAVVLCVVAPMVLILNLLRELANRACMLEDMGVVASYKRGVEVLRANLGPAIVLFLIQVAITIGLGVLMIIPGIVLVLCCILWPILLLLQGGIAAYFSTLWTLAWRVWTGGSSLASLPVPAGEGDDR
jgi:hypothetical protein